MMKALKERLGGVSAGSACYIAPETVVSGDIKTEAHLIVAGKIDGNVTCSVLQLAESGAIVGSVTAEEVHLSGLVRGGVSAERIRLEPTARLTGDATYGRISVADGAKVQGKMVQKTSDLQVSSLQAAATARQKVGAEATAEHVLPLSRGTPAS